MRLIALPALKDNYIWMIHNAENAIVVDPGDASVVIKALEAFQLNLVAILVTHHHDDHIHGLTKLHRIFSQLPVYGPSKEKIADVTHPMREGNIFNALGLQWIVWETPGHTNGHISYLVPAQPGLPCPEALVFCGDTLFSAGCGRVFDGTHEQLANSLQRFSELPAQTWLCATHEYTSGNLKFAASLEPKNQAIIEMQTWCEKQLAAGEATLPTTVERELRINPFLRTQQPAIVEQAFMHGATNDSHVAVFTALRLWKDQFKA